MHSLLLASTLAALSLPALAGELTLDAMHDLLRSSDATTVVQSLDKGDDWGTVLDHVERGDVGWVLLIPALAPGTDAGTAEGLTIALSRALKVNPQVVLALIAGQYVAAAEICLDNDIEVSAFEAAAFIDAALVAVAGVLDPALMEARNACLGVLGDARISALI